MAGFVSSGLGAHRPAVDSAVRGSPRSSDPVRTKSHRVEPQHVLVASASAALRKRWSQGLRGFAIQEADQRAALEQSIVQVGPAVVFIDLALPGLGGLSGVPAIQRLNPTAKIVLLAGEANEGEAVFALVAGARGYCQRNIGPSLVRKATEVVQRGEIWIGSRVIPLLLKNLTGLTPVARDDARSAAEGPFDSLAPRERQIAELVGAGSNNKEIAARLNITEATVKAHLTSVFRKLNVSDRLRLALFVTERKSHLR
jgi:DNA-binding NarL/FixJ family response regulator